MQRSLVSYALLVAVICLVSGPAMAEDCKSIQVRIGPGTYLDPCFYAGIDFLFCIEAPLQGTINGTWNFYGEEDNGVFPEPGDPYSSFAAGWGLGVFETKKGDIELQDNWLWNLNAITDDHVPFVSMMNITGGTGHYEGASGWVGVIADDSGDWRGWARGMICTP